LDRESGSILEAISDLLGSSPSWWEGWFRLRSTSIRLRSTSIEFRLRKLIENKKIKVSAEIFTSIGEILWKKKQLIYQNYGW
jgi:hypothetical protein